MRTKLSPRSIDAAKPAEKPFEIPDADVSGLLLRVQPSGVKSFVVTWGRGKRRTLGRYPVMTVTGARQAAMAALTEAAHHGAPLAVTKAKQRADVAGACREYVAWLHKEGREGASQDADRRFERCIYGDKLGAVRLVDLQQSQLEAWRDRVETGRLAPLPAKRGRPPTAGPLAKATVNRMRTTLVAALNHALARRQVPAELAIEWNSVKPLKGAGGRRELYLDRTQRRALVDATEGPARDLVECVALTGCRPGDPAACLRKDFDDRSASVRFRTKGHDRQIPLSPAAAALFERLAAGKGRDAHLFVQENGKAWTSDAWSAPVRSAAERAGLPPGVTLYVLRHCWITDAIVAGMDLLTVAKLAGTSLAMIEKHYGHLVQGAARDKLAQVQFL